MKKINWFSRLFMSWSSLETYFGNTPSGNDNETVELLRKQYEDGLKFKDEQIESLKIQLSEVKTLANKFEAELNATNSTIGDKDRNLERLQTDLNTLRTQLNERTDENSVIKNDIRDQLKTIGKIERTFFAQTANKGKGELGEQQVRVILEKSGLPQDMYVENLTVGKNTVEFAMQSGEEGKYIPIDSKVLDAVIVDGKAVIDESYKSRVRTQAKEITKYLSKANTADYGILVLQSDSIYMELFNNYPTFFQDMITEYKIHVNSPSSFVQTAWSIAQLIQIYKRVHNDEKIYEDMLDALSSVSKFANSLSKVHKDFNVAMDTHYPTITKRHSNLIKRLDKEDKIKSIPSIDKKEGK